MDLEKYADMLREKDLKVTPHRLGVLRYLDENRTHPTADDIYRALKKNSPSLSKTTVYNVLDVLEDREMVDVLTISGIEARYDLKMHPHQHFMCKSCGRIIDIYVERHCLDCFPEKGHKVEEVHGYFKGICRDCLKGVGG